MQHNLAVLLAALAAACGQATSDTATPRASPAASLLDHDGALRCSSLVDATGSLADVCAPDPRETVSLTVEAPPIRASRWRVLAALLDADQFGALPRPLPPGFEAPPAPHSVRRPASATSPFVDHYVLFWGLLEASTVRVSVGPQTIEVVQLWRVDNQWSERDIRDGYPDIAASELSARVGTPIMPEGMYSIVTFRLRTDGDSTRITMVQRGSPPFNKPVFAVHWQGLYFHPLKKGVEASP